MSVVSVTRRWSGRSSGSVLQQGRDHDEVYDVETSTHTDNADVARLAVPSLGSVYNVQGIVDISRRVTSIKATARTPTLWEVAVHWSKPQSTSGSGADGEIHPLNRPVERSFGFVSANEPIDHDFTNKPIENTVGEPFDPPVVFDNAEMRWTFVRNEESIDLDLHLLYMNVTNSDPFAGASIGRCLMRPITAESAFEVFQEEDVHFFRVTYTIDVRRPTTGTDTDKLWHKRILNAGFKEKKGENIVLALDDSGKAETQPVKLDENGVRLAQDATPHWLFFPVYDKKPFAVWGIH